MIEHLYIAYVNWVSNKHQVFLFWIFALEEKHYSFRNLNKRVNKNDRQKNDKWNIYGFVSLLTKFSSELVLMFILYA